jgi:hypothetical protein
MHVICKMQKYFVELIHASKYWNTKFDLRSQMLDQDYDIAMSTGDIM